MTDRSPAATLAARKPRPAFLLILLVLSAAGCAGPRLFANPGAPPERARAAAVLERVDAAVRVAGVRDSADFPVRGFPYLRADGYLVGLRDRLDTPERAARWLELLRERDRAGRDREIANLPGEEAASLASGLGVAGDRAALAAEADRAADTLLALDRKAPGFLRAVRGAVRFRDEYSSAMRLLGLYPIATIPVAIGTTNAYEKVRALHRMPLDQVPRRGGLRAYAPADPLPFDRARVAGLYRALPRDAFGAPTPGPEALDALFRTFAPVVVQDEAGSYDRIGTVGWSGADAAVEGAPAAYRYATWTFVRGMPALQLNYAFWYASRAGAAPRLEQGPLDGFTVRVTLGDDGCPAIVDTTNNCGCYFFFVPRRDLVAGFRPTELGEAPLVPAWIPEGCPDAPLQLRVSSGWHQIQHVDAAAAPADALPYALLPYGTLESLPRGDGRRESVFDPDGIMKGSWRIEPYVFFSMGIPKVGYMRQRGHHPISLVGRRHFTDPDLYDASFLWR